MEILVVGNGGREHALAWRLARSPGARVRVAPGNAGTDARAVQPTLPLPSGRPSLRLSTAEAPGTVENLDVADLDGLIAWCAAYRPDLVVVGPEEPLSRGLVDALSALGIAAFGPTAEAARIEASKAWAKAVMDEAGVPTARWVRCTDKADALGAVRWFGERVLGDGSVGRVVVKQSGLAAGKGVIVCDGLHEAIDAVNTLADGSELVIEERLIGEEVSILAFVDGERWAVMPAAQDHKRVGDGDTGPNTGGMGAVAPAPVAAGREEELARIAIAPVVRWLAARGTPFRGVLYAGLMLTPAGPRVLEYNCRFGDPEAQVLLPLLQSDLASVLLACARGRLDPQAVQWHRRAACAVVAAAHGYPGEVRRGDRIGGLDAAAAMPGVAVFCAGARRDDDAVVTHGGRVLAVTGVGDDLREAIARAYAGLGAIHFDGMHHRRDIGAKATARETP